MQWNRKNLITISTGIALSTRYAVSNPCHHMRNREYMNILIRAFGCTANFGEATAHRRLLEAEGHNIVSDPALADMALVQTCCVIERTELNMLREMGTLLGFGLPVIVSGCMSVARRGIVEERFPAVRFLPFGSERELPALVHELAACVIRGSDILKDRIVADGTPEDEMKDPSEATVPPACNFTRKERKGSSLDSLIGSNVVSPEAEKLSITHIQVISNGCLGSCAYCITRLARGPLRSYSLHSIRAEIKAALETGKKEVFITSQDNAVYGFDLVKGKIGDPGPYYLPELLSDILSDNEDVDFRMRVGMMNPWGLERIVDGLLPVMRSGKIYSFLHLPVQSGDDEILRAMGRRYTVAEYVNLVERLRVELPGLTLSTDVIVGFPGETDASFRKTVELLEQVRPEVVNITRFSPRPGTPAAAVTSDRVPGWKAKNRSRELTRLRFDNAGERLRTKVGTTVKALSVERGTRGSTLLRCDDYTTLVVRDVLPLGLFMNVDITDCTDIYVTGRIREQGPINR